MYRKQILRVHILQSGQFGRKRKQKNPNKKVESTFFTFYGLNFYFCPYLFYLSPNISLPNLCGHKSRNNNFSFSFLFPLQVKQRITSFFSHFLPISKHIKGSFFFSFSPLLLFLSLLLLFLSRETKRPPFISHVKNKSTFASPWETNKMHTVGDWLKLFLWLFFFFFFWKKNKK